jgi:hypothetical protein
MTPLAFMRELAHMQPIGAWAGIYRPSLQVRLVASVFSLSDLRKAMKKPHRHEACGHDSAAARATRPPPCRFLNFVDGRLRPAASCLRPSSRTKEDNFD